jgi:hypothetical protein
MSGNSELLSFVCLLCGVKFSESMECCPHHCRQGKGSGTFAEFGLAPVIIARLSFRVAVAGRHLAPSRGGRDHQTGVAV